MLVGCKGWLFFVFFCTRLLTINGQNVCQVLSKETDEPIPFATVQWEGNSGTYTDQVGQFQVPVFMLGQDFVVSCVGFETDTFRIIQDNCFLRLKPAKIVLRPIVVSDKELQPLRLGAPKRRKGNTSFGAKEGTQWALFISNEEQRAGYIQSIHYLISDGLSRKVEPKNSFFRIHLFENESEMPGKDLLGNVVVRPYKNSGWQRLNVSEYGVRIPKEGIFISMEWLQGAPTATYEYTTKESKEKYEGEQYGHSLVGHLNSNDELKLYYLRVNEGEKKWVKANEAINSGLSHYIPCLAIGVIED